jgi:hypothetical protein
MTAGPRAAHRGRGPCPGCPRPGVLAGSRSSAPVWPTAPDQGTSLAGRPRGGFSVEGGRVPQDRGGGQEGRHHGVFRRRGQCPFGLPRGHHLGPARSHPVVNHRSPVQGEPDLSGHRQGRPAVLHHRGYPDRTQVHRLLQTPAARPGRARLPDPRRPPGAPVNGRARVRRIHLRTPTAIPAYCPQLNPDEWVGRHVKYDRRLRALTSSKPSPSPRWPPANHAQDRPRIRRRSQPDLHRQDGLKSTPSRPPSVLQQGEVKVGNSAFALR